MNSEFTVKVQLEMFSYTYNVRKKQKIHVITDGEAAGWLFQ